jgi:hypothetical protein
MGERRLRAMSTPLDRIIEDADRRYPEAGATVDGRLVRSHTPNTDSIDGYFADQETLHGIREVPMSDFGGPRSVFYAVDDFERSHELADRINESGEINPLIIGYDEGGPFIIEGAHRFVALHYLGARAFPALIVAGTDE